MNRIEDRITVGYLRRVIKETIGVDLIDQGFLINSKITTTKKKINKHSFIKISFDCYDYKPLRVEFGSAAKLTKASSGTLFNDKQSIFGHIKWVDIVVPAGVQGNSSSATTAQQKTSVTNTKPENQQTNSSKTQVTKE